LGAAVIVENFDKKVSFAVIALSAFKQSPHPEMKHQPKPRNWLP